MHDNFRLIVVADKNAVYNPKKYPIPLINRLEKHLLNMDSVLIDKMKTMVAELEKWCNEITSISEQYAGFSVAGMRAKGGGGASAKRLKPSDLFIGFNQDTLPSLVYKLCQQEKYGRLFEDINEFEYDWKHDADEIVQSIKMYLLQCCTSDGIIRLLQKLGERPAIGPASAASASAAASRMSATEIKDIINVYFHRQTHDNFSGFFENVWRETRVSNSDDEGNAEGQSGPVRFVQITTHSKLISKKDTDLITQFNRDMHFRIESLLSFDTQQQFVNVLREFFDAHLRNNSAKRDNNSSNNNKNSTPPNVFIIQCDSGQFYQELINCARFTIIDEFAKYDVSSAAQAQQKLFVVLVVQVPKISGGCIAGFQTSKWFCYHVDDLQDELQMGSVLQFDKVSIGELLSVAARMPGDASSNKAVEMENGVSKADRYFQFFINLLKSIVYTSCSKVVDINAAQANASDAIDAARKRNNPNNNGNVSALASTRQIKRIDLLLKLLQPNEGVVAKERFCQCVVKHLAVLQTQREIDTSTLDLSRTWMSREVSRIANVVRHGTLKNSCRNYMDMRLTSLFAGLLAFVDVNANLDLLLVDEKSDSAWLVALWLDLFDDDEFMAASLTYSSRFLTVNQREKTEFVCSNIAPAGSSDNQLRARLPFSWLMINYLDRLTSLKLSDEPSPDAEAAPNSLELHMNQLANAIEQSGLLKRLNGHVKAATSKQTQFIDMYLNDFLLLKLADQYLTAEKHLALLKNRVLNYCYQANYCTATTPQGICIRETKAKTAHLQQMCSKMKNVEAKPNNKSKKIELRNFGNKKIFRFQYRVSFFLLERPVLSFGHRN